MSRKRAMIPPWISRGALNLAGPLHEIPRKSNKVLPKFDMDKLGSPEDHIKKLFLSTLILNFQHEYVVYKLFIYAFSSKASKSYLSKKLVNERQLYPYIRS
jgi:hypothetical protein